MPIAGGWIASPLAQIRLSVLGLVGQHPDLVRRLEFAATVRMTAKNQEFGGRMLPHYGPHDIVLRGKFWARMTNY